MNKIINYLKQFGFYFLFLLLGIFIFTYPMIQTGFDLIPNYGMKFKYYSYILEHSFLYIQNIEPHQIYFSAPFLYPQTNTTALFDTLLPISPFYFLIRLIIKEPITALQTLFYFLCIINYSTFYYLLNKSLKYSHLSSSIGSFVFAFSILRYFDSENISYFCQFFTVLFLIFLFKINSQNTQIKNHIYFLLASISIIFEFYCSYEIAFFTVFIGIFAILFALLPKTGRDIITSFYKKFKVQIIFYIFVIFSMLIPLFYRLVCASNVTMFPDFIKNISNYSVWLRNVSLIDSFLLYKIPYADYNSYKYIYFGMGFLTTVFAFLGIKNLKYSKGVPVLLLCLLFFISCGTFSIYFWRVFYLLTPAEFLPSIKGIAYIALILVSFLTTNLIEYLKNVEFNKCKKYAIIFGVVLLIFLEQIPKNTDEHSAWKNYVVSKKDFIEQLSQFNIPKECEVVSFSYILVKNKKDEAIKNRYQNEKINELENLFGMHLALRNRLKTTNGYKVNENYKEKIKVKDVCSFKKAIDFSEI